MRYSVNMLLKRPRLLGDRSPVEGVVIERVLWMSQSASHIATIDIDPTHVRAWPCIYKREDLDDAFAAGSLEVIEEDPFRKLLPPEDRIPLKQRQHRDSAWGIIQEIVTTHEADLFSSAILGPMVCTAAERSGKHKKRVYVCLRRYWQGGQHINALLPLYYRCGGKGKERINRSLDAPKRGRPSKWSKRHGEPDGVNTTPEILEQIRHIKSLCYERQKLSFADTYHQFYTTYYHAGYELKNGVLVPNLKPPQEVPTLNQYRYWFFKDADLTKSLRARLGQCRFEETMRPLLGSVLSNIFGPGSMFYYDSTIADIYLVSRLNRRRIVGRPVIHAIIDLFSGLIVAVAVLLEDASWDGAKRAILNIVEDKREMCAAHGIADVEPQDWPCNALPRAITGDRGELFTREAEVLCQRLAIHRATPPPYRPTWKAAVERNFRTLNDLTIDDLPGHVVARRRGEPDYRLDAKLNIDEFRAILLDAIVRYNRSQELSLKHYTQDMIAAEVEPYPCSLWQWGIENCAGQLNTRTLKQMRLDLLPSGQATVHRDGLHFGGVRYTAPIAEREQWFVRVQTLHKPWIVPVRYDKTRNQLFLELENDLEPCQLHADEARFIGCDWYDIDDFFAAEDDKGRERKHKKRQDRVEHEAFRQEIIERAEAEVATMGEEDLSKAEQLRGIRENRKAEAKLDRSQHGHSPSRTAHPARKTDPATTRRLQLLNDDV